MKRPETSKLGRISRAALSRLPIATAIHFACVALAFADADPQGQPPPAPAEGSSKVRELETITVTAQKRTENPQDVPISLEVLSQETLQQLNVNNFVDYVKAIPSVSIESAGPGFGQVYMRGVASGSNGNHSGPLPSVGQYLDEEPITTIQGALDLHMYDISRVEVLAGPQGTLYGASSQSGTIRVITNKPDPTAFSAQVAVEVNKVDHGGTGFVTEGYINQPLAENIALRVVGWSKEEAGYIDNVFGERTYPTSGITVNNADQVKDNYNQAFVRGGRAALKIDLNDNWSITPTIMGQGEHTYGVWQFDKNLGDLKVSHQFPENSEDRFTQSALTVQGKIGSFDVVYAFAHLNRSDHVDSDYADYSFWYDTLYGYGSYIYNNNGDLIDPGQFIHGHDKYKKTSNELRFSSPTDWRLHYVVGAFAENQSHDIQQEYIIKDLADAVSVPGWPNTLWLTKQKREDDDWALFGEGTFDFTDQWSATLGARYFHTDNSLKGFFGFGTGYSSSTGVGACFSPNKFEGAPCTNLDKDTTENDWVGKANVTYKITPDALIYGTYSEGFRPGGINRRGSLPPYQSDFLKNYEFGWKTEWMDHHLRWNGAVFQENWDDFQFAILGANGLTEIKNANKARIRGIESNIAWAATYNLTLTAGAAYYKSELTADYCGFTELDGTPVSHCPPGTINPITGDPVDGPEAPAGTRLPITAREKGNLVARYVFNIADWESYFQVAGFAEGRRRTDLRTVDNAIIGDLPGYGTIDLSWGIKRDKWAFDVYLKNAGDNRGELSRFAECATSVCGPNPANRTPEQLNLPGQTYIVPVQPRTLGIRVTRDF